MMQDWLHTIKGADIPEQTVWYRMDKLKYSYKSGRPCPVQGDQKKQESFKKGPYTNPGVGKTHSL